MEVSEKLIQFIKEHANDDVVSLRLKNSGKEHQEFDLDIDFALVQIEARRKARKKLPSYLENDHFLFPTLLSEEQASNEVVARFHASLIKPNSTVLDMTAGLGIDDMEFAKVGITVTSCEIEAIKCEALRHNAEMLGLCDKIEVVNCDSIEYIDKCKQKITQVTDNQDDKQSKSFDVVFSDPARRNNSGKRVHALSDCQPDILSAMPEILKTVPRLLVKSSPLLDLSLIRDTVNDLKRIYVVCFKGECKEVLIDIEKDSTFDGVTVVDLDWQGEISRFDTIFNGNEASKEARCDRKKVSDYKYLYEPNSGVMKTGAWSDLLANFPNLFKADPNTHIFFSDTLYADFPGRVMTITSEPDKKALKALKGAKMNIVSRNHPLSAPQIAKKYSLISGSDQFLYAFKYQNTPSFVIASSHSLSSADK